MKLDAPSPLTLRLPKFERVAITLAGCGGSGDEGSGLRAVQIASELLMRGDVDWMLAGAVDLAGERMRQWRGHGAAALPTCRRRCSTATRSIT